MCSKFSLDSVMNMINTQLGMIIIIYSTKIIFL